MLSKCLSNKEREKKTMASFMKFLSYKLDILASVNDLLPSFPCCCFLIEKSEIIKSKSGYCFLINDLDSKKGGRKRKRERESRNFHNHEQFVWKYFDEMQVIWCVFCRWICINCESSFHD